MVKYIWNKYGGCDYIDNNVVIVYSNTACNSCKQLKKYLESVNIKYEERNIDTEENYVSYFSDKLTLSENYKDRSSLELPAIVLNAKFYSKNVIFTDDKVNGELFIWVIYLIKLCICLGYVRRLYLVWVLDILYGGDIIIIFIYFMGLYYY